MATTNAPVTLDTLIAVKINFDGQSKRFKLPLRDLTAQVLPEKLRALLQLQPDDAIVFERYSDSVGAFVTLDADKPQVYKTLFRAAKAKLKLRLRASYIRDENEPESSTLAVIPVEPVPRPVSLYHMSTDTLRPQIPVGLSPVIAHSPLPPAPVSNYKCSEVETAQASPVSPLMADKAPVEKVVLATRASRHSFFNGPAQASSIENTIPRNEVALDSWAVFCNNCNKAMEDEHFHCGICDYGDYDLCPSCVNTGVHCPGVGHWMVKRFLKNGCVVNSTTERVEPKPKPHAGQEMPGAFMEEKQSVVDQAAEDSGRTCNCCVKVLPEKEFVTCTNCEDYDLCVECHLKNKHGHHPGHVFEAASGESSLSPLAEFLCKAGRNMRHSAVCDGCDKFIYGVRHKCLNCPDWDYCSECIKKAKFIHPRHRFVPIYEPLPEPVTNGARHIGIYCDGPLCKGKDVLSYIEGVRYKCAVCNDTDFCGNCESLPTNKHNHTHPLIKFKTPVRNVSVTTMNESKAGIPLARLGDQPARKSTATETTPVASATNAATQVQTVLEVKPVEETQQPKANREKMAIRDLLTEPVQEKISVKDLLCAEPAPKAKPCKIEDLDAHFIRDTITDGTPIATGMTFVQTWTMRNPGPNFWPAGCSVRHVGGDNMLNLDNSRALSQDELAEASGSNVIHWAVEPGEEILFRVVMKAPLRQGVAISYWRLKTADGTPFGQRLWCDIRVTSPVSPAPVPQAAMSLLGQSPSTAKMTAYERWQHSKMNRLNDMQRAMQQPHAQSYTPKGASYDRLARLHEDALSRLGNMKLSDEKEAQPSLFATLEREKLARIQQVRKAAVERLLENRYKDSQAAVAALKPEPSAESAKVPEVAAVKQETVELPVEEKKSAEKNKPIEAPIPAQASGMIFPQLDKESPESSTHEAVSAKSESEDIRSETSAATIAAPTVQSDDEFFEDAESLELQSVDSDDEAFMTDDEYDILDASDEELA